MKEIWHDLKKGSGSVLSSISPQTSAVSSARNDLVDLSPNIWCNNLKAVFIHVVPDVIIWTVNWLHYLNYEPIAHTSSTCNLVCTMNDLGHTVSSYGWCNGIPLFAPIFRSFLELFASNRLSYRR